MWGLWTKGQETRASARSGAHVAFFRGDRLAGFCSPRPQLIHSMPIPDGVLWPLCRGGDAMDTKAPPVP